MLEQMLANPVIQSVAIPFVAALLVVLLLRLLPWYWAGLAVAAGFYAAAYYIVGFDFFPLRSTTKILILGLLGVGVGLVLDIIPGRRGVWPLLFFSGVAAALWLAWSVLGRYELKDMFLIGGGGVLFVGWMAAMMEGLRDRPLVADSAALSLAAGTGITAMLGATALYSQLGGALAAAISARWLLNVAGKEAAAGSNMVLPVGLLCGLLGFGALVFANLPWYNLALFGLIPLLARVPVPEGWSTWLRGVLLLVMTAVPVGLAIYFTYQERGGWSV
jgi:hypothetical protein